MGTLLTAATRSFHGDIDVVFADSDASFSRDRAAQMGVSYGIFVAGSCLWRSLSRTQMRNILSLSVAEYYATVDVSCELSSYGKFFFGFRCVLIHF